MRKAIRAGQRCLLQLFERAVVDALQAFDRELLAALQTLDFLIERLDALIEAFAQLVQAVDSLLRFKFRHFVTQQRRVVAMSFWLWRRVWARDDGIQPRVFRRRKAAHADTSVSSGSASAGALPSITRMARVRASCSRA